MTGAYLVRTRISHTRRSPMAHTFSYRSSSWFINIDRPPQLPFGLRHCADFRAVDHFPEPYTSGESLRQRLVAHLLLAGVEAPTGHITMLASPRVGGYVFNPLSVFWCHRTDGTLHTVIAEVHNTYGQRHCYLLTTDPDGRAVVTKEFYVSPFHDVSGTYRLHLPEPRIHHPGARDDAAGDPGSVQVSVTLERADAQPFTAALSGRLRPATVAAVVLAQLRSPAAPLVASARIRLQGIALWRRRLPIQPRPAHTITHTVSRHKDSQR